MTGFQRRETESTSRSRPASISTSCCCTHRPRGIGSVSTVILGTMMVVMMIAGIAFPTMEKRDCVLERKLSSRAVGMWWWPRRSGSSSETRALTTGSVALVYEMYVCASASASTAAVVRCVYPATTMTVVPSQTRGETKNMFVRRGRRLRRLGMKTLHGDRTG